MKRLVSLVVILVLVISIFSSAVNAEELNLGGEIKEVTLLGTSEKAYFYIDKYIYEDMNKYEYLKEEVSNTIEKLMDDFDNEIYPKVTSLYGTEWKNGIDNDERITIVFSYQNGSWGYFQPGDQYYNGWSNSREMFYLNQDLLFNQSYDILYSTVAHELTHLISFNQKKRLRNIQVESSLEELRAEHSVFYTNPNSDAYEDDS
jgi:hypothetical protein